MYNLTTQSYKSTLSIGKAHTFPKSKHKIFFKIFNLYLFFSFHLHTKLTQFPHWEWKNKKKKNAKKNEKILCTQN